MSLGLLAAGSFVGTSLAGFIFKGINFLNNKPAVSKAAEKEVISYQTIDEVVKKHARDDFSDEPAENLVGTSTENKQEDKSQTKSKCPYFVIFQALVLSGAIGSYYTATNDSLPEAVKPYDLDQNGLISTDEATKMIRKLNDNKEDMTVKTATDVNKLKRELSIWGISGSTAQSNIDRALDAIRTLNGKIPK